MHPVRRALNAWKRANKGGTDAQFALHVGYTQVDAIYKQMRGEHIAQFTQLQAMAKVLKWTPGRFLNECTKYLLRKSA